MAKEIMYRPLKVYESQGEFVTELFGQPLQHAHLLSDDLRSGKLKYGTAETEEETDILRIAPYHQRVHEVKEGLRDSSAPVLDEFGNIFAPRVVQKGADFTNPHLFESGVSRWGYDIYGVQVGGALGRAIRTSELMRKEGIDTELLVGATRLKEFYWHGEIIDRATYNKRLITSVDVDDTEKERLLGEVEKRDVFTTYRLMAVQERYLDLFTPKTAKELAHLQQNVLTAVNNYEQHKAHLDPAYVPQTFDPNVAEDVKRYMTKYVPQNLGRNVGLMHGLGLHHRYLHLWNVTALGGIVDLDSVRGASTGFPNDTPTTPPEMEADLETVLSEFRSEVLKEGTNQYIRFKHMDATSYDTFKRELAHNYFKTILAKNNFSYLFLTTFYKYKDDLLLADAEYDTEIVTQVEQQIQEKYGAFIPTEEDLIDEEAKRIAEDDSHDEQTVANKNAILYTDIHAYTLLVLQNDHDAESMDELIKSRWYLDALINAGYFQHTENTTAHLHGYIYSVFKRALENSQIAYVVLPYLDTVENILARGDQTLQTNILGELQNEYEHMLPTNETQEEIWSYLLERERHYQDTYFAGNRNPEQAAEYDTNYYRILVDRLGDWADHEYERRSVVENDNIQKALKGDYIIFMTHFMITKFDNEKREALLAYGKEYAAQLAIASIN